MSDNVTTVQNLLLQKLPLVSFFVIVEEVCECIAPTWHLSEFIYIGDYSVTFWSESHNVSPCSVSSITINCAFRCHLYWPASVLGWVEEMTQNPWSMDCGTEDLQPAGMATQRWSKLKCAVDWHPPSHQAGLFGGGGDGLFQDTLAWNSWYTWCFTMEYISCTGVWMCLSRVLFHYHKAWSL